jgi:hypothetical protein
MSKTETKIFRQARQAYVIGFQFVEEVEGEQRAEIILKLVPRGETTLFMTLEEAQNFPLGRYVSVETSVSAAIAPAVSQ